MLQDPDHHVFIEDVQEKVGHHHVVLLELIHLHDVAVDTADGQVWRFCFLGLGKLAQHGFGQVYHGHVGTQFRRTNGIPAMAYAGEQNPVAGPDGFHIQHGGFTAVNVFAAVEIAQEIVDGTDVLVLVAHDDCCLFLFLGCRHRFCRYWSENVGHSGDQRLWI